MKYEDCIYVTFMYAAAQILKSPKLAFSVFRRLTG